MDPDTSHSLLANFLTITRFNAVELADVHGISLFQLLEWFNSDAIRQAISDLLEMADTHARLLAQESAPAAVASLTQLASPPPDPDAAPARAESARRAAGQILRLTTRPAKRVLKPASQPTLPAPADAPIAQPPASSAELASPTPHAAESNAASEHASAQHVPTPARASMEAPDASAPDAPMRTANVPDASVPEASKPDASLPHASMPSSSSTHDQPEACHAAPNALAEGGAGPTPAIPARAA